MCVVRVCACVCVCLSLSLSLSLTVHVTAGTEQFHEIIPLRLPFRLKHLMINVCEKHMDMSKFKPKLSAHEKYFQKMGSSEACLLDLASLRSSGHQFSITLEFRLLDSVAVNIFTGPRIYI